MAYTAPQHVSDGDAYPASQYNTEVVDNIAALFNSPSAAVNYDNASDKTTTSSSFVDIDTANLAVTLTLDAVADVLIGFTGLITTSGGGFNSLDITMDGVRLGTDDGIQGFGSSGASGVDVSVSMLYLARNVAAGTHVFRPQWKVKSGNTLTLYSGAGTSLRDVHPHFFAKQL